MGTDCSASKLSFQRHRRRRVEADFDGGHISSFGGGLLLREVEARRGILRRLARCFADGRDPSRAEFPVEQLVAQRVYGLALGYEDVEDHDRLRHDPLLATLVGVEDVLGAERPRQRDQGVPLASSSTLHRLEHSPDGRIKTERHYRFTHDTAAMDRLLVDLFLEAHPTRPEKIILDLDATDDPLHGGQEGRFFHGYYRCYCYLPLYIFCGDFPLCARLRRSNIGADDGCLEEVDAIVEQIRAHWPEMKIVLRADSGFARDVLMSWCEENEVDFVFGMARNPRLEKLVEPAFEALGMGVRARSYHDFVYRTRDSWSCARRLVAKAEVLTDKRNPRFVVTSFGTGRIDAETLYREVYCARGEMENRIKEQQLGLFADRTSTALMRSNQLRLYFSTFAYLLLSELRRLGLAGTKMARAHAGTIRDRLLRVGARVYVSVRRVLCRMTSAYVDRSLFVQVYQALRGPPHPA